MAKKTTVGRRVVLMNGLGSSSLALEQGRLDTFGVKAKIDYLVLDVKLALINMNYVNFLFFRNFIDRKNLTKIFILIDVADCSSK